MKVIFLDIDGVLSLSSSGFRLIPEKVKILNDLRDWKVVISSDWGYNEATVKSLIGCGLELPIIGGIREPWEEGGKERYIKRWIKENNPEEWIILEDEEEIDLPGVIKIDGNIGLEKLEGYN